MPNPFSRTVLIIPVLGDRTATMTPPSTTQEIKWGRYSRFWISRLKPLSRTSLSISAKRIGAGNTNKSL
ncbi:hypothetical protein D3C73_1393740 [compost metagenome]